jgi:acid stress-induced BolA-like protein IbaG/YrbA
MRSEKVPLDPSLGRGEYRQMSTVIIEQIREAIEKEMPGATAEVTGSEGHYSVTVVSETFAGKGMLDNHRVVYAAIAHLMSGDGAPVHAIDRLKTTAP